MKHGHTVPKRLCKRPWTSNSTISDPSPQIFADEISMLSVDAVVCHHLLVFSYHCIGRHLVRKNKQCGVNKTYKHGANTFDHCSTCVYLQNSNNNT